jgi:putative membrane protein
MVTTGAPCACGFARAAAPGSPGFERATPVPQPVAKEDDDAPKTPLAIRPLFAVIGFGPLSVSRMKVLTPLAAIVGLALLTGLTAYYGFAPVGQAVASAGWGAALVVLARAVAVGGAGIGWGLLVPGALVHRPGLFVGVRFVREAINCLFPVAQVGGDLIGARLLTFFGVGPGLAFASVLVDIFVQVATLLVFVLAGVGLLLAESDDHGLALTVSYGLLVAVPAIAGFFVVLRLGASQSVTQRLVRFAEQREWAAAEHVASLSQNLQRLWQHRNGLLGSLLVHAGLWVFGATEVWVALAFMGHPVTVLDAVAIESVGQAVRAAAFAMPGGLGIQDGGLIAVCGAFGVPPEVALALALLKRIAELVLGVPGLLAWQMLEGRRLIVEKQAAAAGPRRPELGRVAAMHQGSSFERGQCQSASSVDSGGVG